MIGLGSDKKAMNGVRASLGLCLLLSFFISTWATLANNVFTFYFRMLEKNWEEFVSPLLSPAARLITKSPVSTFLPKPTPHISILPKTNGTKCCYFKNVVAKSKYVRLKVEVDKMQTIKTSLRQLPTRPLQLKARAVSWKSNSNFYSQRILNSQPSLTKIVDEY